ncbi:MAG: aminoacyl-tRNA hydrolase [Candidatus Omnitrophica bacterium]|nr:aminoacyl-tRNA hydrolase [Candidatus Omnitrophota bacterium]
MRLIVGLGNPGKDYEHTRHNLGFLVVRRLAEKLRLKFSRSSLTKGMTAKGVFEGETLWLLAPLTYVNDSGVAVSQFMSKKDLSSDDILVVCDDFHLDFEQIRLRARGSDGGHNGLSSVIQHLGTEEFARLRMGIGCPPDSRDTVDYVLGEFKKTEEARLKGFVDEAVSCCLIWLRQGINAAMGRHNRRKEA